MNRTRVLVVDDEKNIRLSLQEALEPLGYEVLSAADGTSALDAMETGRPAIMLLVVSH